MSAPLLFLASKDRTPDGFAQMCVQLHLLSQPPVAGDQDWAHIEALRAAIERCAGAVVAGEPLAQRAVDTLNSFADAEPPAPVLSLSGTVRRSSPDPVAAALSAIAREAIALFAADRSRLRKCSAPDCGQFFVDTSRGARRRWCSMTRCGNRSKVGAFRRRRQR
jgi:predicted RNA-binding Zn ribbon-like protein